MDSEWVENLNSALDDNKILSLGDGQRLKLPDKLRFIFETQELSQVSPATITRCGVTYISAQTLTLNSLIQKFFKEINFHLPQNLIN